MTIATESMVERLLESDFEVLPESCTKADMARILWAKDFVSSLTNMPFRDAFRAIRDELFVADGEETWFKDPETKAMIGYLARNWYRISTAHMNGDSESNSISTDWCLRTIAVYHALMPTGLMNDGWRSTYELCARIVKSVVDDIEIYKEAKELLQSKRAKQSKSSVMSYLKVSLWKDIQLKVDGLMWLAYELNVESGRTFNDQKNEALSWEKVPPLDHITFFQAGVLVCKMGYRQGFAPWMPNRPPFPIR